MMQKIMLRISVIVLILSSSLVTNAQKFSFLAKAGADFSGVYGGNEGDYISYKGKVGFYAGGSMNLNITKKFFVQPSLLYSLQGYKRLFVYHENGVVGNQNNTVALHYINLPIVAGYRFSPKLSISIGPQIGYLAAATLKQNVLIVSSFFHPETAGTQSKSTYHGTDGLERMAFSGLFLMTIKVTSRLNAELGYHKQFTNLRKNFTQGHQQTFTLGGTWEFKK